MKEYLLFIDTEASGLPKNWKLPYDASGNWPYCVQISWIIFTKTGEKIKKENHYIKNDDFSIADSASKVHHIDRAFLNANGEYRHDVLQQLADDMLTYNPLVVGHFIQFDLHMLSADFFRAEMEIPIKKELSFCTMLGSTHLIKNPSVKFLRLEQLYETLFESPLLHHHNAIIDAAATAQCFFELARRGDINDEIILQQQRTLLKKETIKPPGCLFPMLAILLLTFLIFYL